MVFRKGEKEQVRYRSDRCFRVPDGWYIATREGNNIGPFNCRQAAERAARYYLKVMRESGKSGLDAKNVVLDRIWTATSFG